MGMQMCGSRPAAAYDRVVGTFSVTRLPTEGSLRGPLGRQPVAVSRMRCTNCLGRATRALPTTGAWPANFRGHARDACHLPGDRPPRGDRVPPRSTWDVDRCVLDLAARMSRAVSSNMRCAARSPACRKPDREWDHPRRAEPPARRALIVHDYGIGERWEIQFAS